MSRPSRALREAAEGTGLSFTLAAELPRPPWMKCEMSGRVEAAGRCDHTAAPLGSAPLGKG